MINYKIVASLEKELKEAEKLATDDFKKTVYDFLVRLKQETPVDTGEAARSWKMTVNQLTKTVEVLNDEDYIKYLNAGSSRQAPSHFIEQLALRYGIPTGPIVEYLK